VWKDLQGRWQAVTHLHLGPDERFESASSMTVTAFSGGQGEFAYDWKHEGKTHIGRLWITNENAAWVDIFHQSESVMLLHREPSDTGLSLFGDFASVW
jgi:hypothetical protein